MCGHSSINTLNIMNIKTLLKLGMASLLFLGLFFVTACEKSNSEKAADAVEDAGDAVGDAVEDAGDAIKDATN
jgi:hypothetical protein